MPDQLANWRFFEGFVTSINFERRIPNVVVERLTWQYTRDEDGGTANRKLCEFTGTHPSIPKVINARRQRERERESPPRCCSCVRIYSQRFGVPHWRTIVEVGIRVAIWQQQEITSLIVRMQCVRRLSWLPMWFLKRYNVICFDRSYSCFAGTK